MKQKLIIGNWKSNKTISEAEDWFRSISQLELQNENKTVIICPPFHLLLTCFELIKKYNLPFKLGAQDISPFGVGAYTGEIAGEELKELIEFVLIGHSERRQNFGETDEMIAKKITHALESEIRPILCVQGIETPVPENVEIVAYEPIFAIGTGNPDTPENAEVVSRFFKEKGIESVIYGGSVNGQNVSNFLEKESIDGVLPGKASLNPQEFVSIISNA